MSRLPKIFQDEKFLNCILLAKNSKGKERFGSILVKGEDIIGEGYNRAIVHKQANINLDRTIRQGYANHAEVEAMNNSIELGHDISGSQVYVAGYFAQSGNIFFQDKYTCLRCPPHFQKYGISEILIPTPNGWAPKSIEEATGEAKLFLGDTHQKRKNSQIGNHTISQLESFLR